MIFFVIWNKYWSEIYSLIFTANIASNIVILVIGRLVFILPTSFSRLKIHYPKSVFPIWRDGV